ncbi:MAG: hypothetical protein JKY08_00985 [Flavobacteriaceae bacterium]|nr:hypothetical protein [Flavobacteriaceae bacterium]
MKPDHNKHSLPFLSTRTRKNNFETPLDYFKNVEDAVASGIELEKIRLDDPLRFKLPKGALKKLELSVIAKLQSEILYKDSPNNTSVPVGYFDSIEDSVLKKLPKKGKLLRFNTVFIKVLGPIAIAASLLLLFTLNTGDKSNAVPFENISNSDIESWVENGDLVFSVEDFTAQVTDVTLELDDFSTIFNDEQALDFLESSSLENILFND